MSVFRSLIIFLCCLVVAQAAALTRRESVESIVDLNPPAEALPGRQVVEGNFQSYSIEFNYMLDYAGNLSDPNNLSINLLKNLADITGSYPIIRAGGTTQNRAIYLSNQTEALIETFSTSGADEPSTLSIGPLWYESFKVFPKGTKYIYGLNFGDGESGLEQTVLEANTSWAAIGNDIYAYEIGNEVDGFPGGRRPDNWTVQDYVNQWKQYAQNISEYAIGEDLDSEVEPLFQAGAFEAPRHINNDTYFQAQSIIDDGIDTTGKAKTISEHDYMGSSCEGNTSPATLQGNLMTRTRMTSLMWYHDFLSNYSVSHGVPYVIGETNSISCAGEFGISDVFGASLWSIDYVLYVAQLHVSRIYFHNGTPYRYSAWQPVAVNETAAGPKALYYGNLFVAEALAGGNKQVELLVNDTTLSAYGIYEAGLGLSKIALINLDMYNSTQPADERPYIQFDLPHNISHSATFKRLTAPGAEVSTNITWGSQSITPSGTYMGTPISEPVTNGSVLLGASEAILISLSD